MATPTRNFLWAFEGSKGKAEVYEIVHPATEGVVGEKVEYEVVSQSKKETVMTMGEASILASELSGKQP